jgi:hypothetical protein
LTDVGINDKFMMDTAAAIQPGTAALFVLVREFTADKVFNASSIGSDDPPRPIGKIRVTVDARCRERFSTGIAQEQGDRR